MTERVGFEWLGPGDGARVAPLRLGPGQDAFATHPAAALEAAEAGVDVYAIVAEGTVIGALKIDLRYRERNAFARPGEVGLRGFMIDAKKQRRGLATAAVRALGSLVGLACPGATGIVLTVNCVNPAAIACYRAGGFVDTGEIDLTGRAGPQHVMRMTLGAA